MAVVKLNLLWLIELFVGCCSASTWIQADDRQASNSGLQRKNKEWQGGKMKHP